MHITEILRRLDRIEAILKIKKIDPKTCSHEWETFLPDFEGCKFCKITRKSEEDPCDKKLSSEKKEKLARAEVILRTSGYGGANLKWLLQNLKDTGNALVTKDLLERWTKLRNLEDDDV